MLNPIEINNNSLQQDDKFHCGGQRQRLNCRNGNYHRTLPARLKNDTTMKNLIFVTSLIFLTLSVFGQNGLKNGKLFLLLKDDRTISINSFENDKINEIKSFSISEKSIYTTDQKERVAILDTAKNEVSIFEIKSSAQIKLTIPFEIKPKTILINNDLSLIHI